MAAPHIAPRTPITSRADRADGRVRLIEEAVLLIRGKWPAVAYGLCESVNRATGLVIAPAHALDEAIEETAEEALRLVERLYGHDGVQEVKRRAVADQDAGASAAPRVRRRARLRSSVRARASAPWRRR